MMLPQWAVYRLLSVFGVIDTCPDRAHPHATDLASSERNTKAGLAIRDSRRRAQLANNRNAGGSQAGWVLGGIVCLLLACDDRI